MTGMVTAALISLIILGSDMRATPPAHVAPCADDNTRAGVSVLISAAQDPRSAYRTFETQVRGNALQGHDRARAGRLGDARLLHVHDVHDNAAPNPFMPPDSMRGNVRVQRVSACVCGVRASACSSACSSARART